MLTQGQLRERKSGVGSSDVPAILGMLAFRDALGVWYDKVNPEITRDEATEQQQRGNDLEPVAIERYARLFPTLRVVRNEATTYRVNKIELATPDALCHEGEAADGLSHGLEAKTRRSYSVEDGWGEVGTDEVPVAVACQCHWCMHVLDLPRWDVALLVDGEDFKWYTLLRDAAIEAELVEAVTFFWYGHVKPKVPPTLNLKPCSRGLAGGLYPFLDDTIVPATHDDEPLVEELRECDGQAKRCAERAEEIKATLRLRIGMQGVGGIEGRLVDGTYYKVTAKKNKAGTVVLRLHFKEKGHA